MPFYERMADHCTCEPGRASDGSEHGPCEYCEQTSERERYEAHQRPPEPADFGDDSYAD
jgi:hypothetical protein